MFPQLKLTSARAAFARPGPHATAFPDVNALMQPSDSLVPIGRRSGRPSPTAYLGAEVLFFPAAPVPPLTDATPETFLPRLPISRLSPKEKRGDPRCLGHPVSCVPWSNDPAGCVPPLAHLAVRSPSPSSYPRPSASGIFANFGATYPRPTRSRTYASPDPLPAPAQGSLPARAGSPLAGRDSHPLDDEQGFMKSSHPSFLLDQPCLVAPDKWRTAGSGSSGPRCR